MGGVKSMRRKSSAEEKMAIVPEGLGGQKTISEICKECGIFH